MSDSPAQPETAAFGNELVSDRVPDPVEWVLFAGSRWAVAAGFLIVFLALFGSLLLADLVAVSNADSITRLLAALVGGNLTLITVVISTNQLILSREFSLPAELHEQITEMVAYRQAVAEMIDTDVSRATPDAFLDFLVTILREEAVALDATATDRPEDAWQDLEGFTDRLLAEAERISTTLEGTTKNPFETLLVVLNAGFTADLYEARRLQTMHGTAFPSEVEAQLDEVVETLEHIGIARQYIKSLYFQRELAGVSRKILYMGVPAFGLLFVTIWVYGGEPAPTVQGPALAALVAVTCVGGLAPLRCSSRTCSGSRRSPAGPHRGSHSPSMRRVRCDSSTLQEPVTHRGQAERWSSVDRTVPGERDDGSVGLRDEFQ